MTSLCVTESGSDGPGYDPSVDPGQAALCLPTQDLSNLLMRAIASRYRSCSLSLGCLAHRIGDTFSWFASAFPDPLFTCKHGLISVCVRQIRSLGVRVEQTRPHLCPRSTNTVPWRTHRANAAPSPSAFDKYGPLAYASSKHGPISVCVRQIRSLGVRVERTRPYLCLRSTNTAPGRTRRANTASSLSAFDKYGPLAYASSKHGPISVCVR